MKQVKKQVLLPYSTQQMFNLVSKVENYPQFLPWCAKVEVFIQTEEIVDAKVHIDFKGIKQFFHTHNIQHSDKNNKSIKMDFVDGPFKHFQGQWTFKELNTNACKVEFSLEYEFTNKILETIIGPLFHIITNTFVDSFIKRAKQIYTSSTKLI